MKTNSIPSQIQALQKIGSVSAMPIIMALSVSLLFQPAGHASQRSSVSETPPLPESIRAQLGTIGVASIGKTPAFSFDKPSGKAGDASEGAKEAAASVLMHPLGLVVAPIAATIGAISEGVKKVAPDELEASEAALARTMSEMAMKMEMRGHFLKAARERLYSPFTFREVTAITSEEIRRSLAAQGIDTVLEIEIESFRLQRTAGGDVSYVLFLDSRARLVRVPDNAVLYDQNFRYRSGACLFIDWTANKADPLRAVADTGCRLLAEKIVEQLFLRPATDCSVGVRGRSLTVHKGQKRSNSTAALPVASSRSRSYGITQISSPAMNPNSLLNAGQIGIISTSTIPKFSVQRPLTKERAMEQARKNVEWKLDLEEAGQIPILNLAFFGAAVPISIAGQTAGAIEGLTETQFQTANAAITRCAAEVNLQESLRHQLARQAQEATTQPVVLVKKPFPAGAEQEFSQMSCVMAGTLAWLPKGQSPAYYLTSQGIDTVLEVQLLYPALNGNGAINPPMAFSTEIRARLLRVKEAGELYSCSIKYRSSERKFTDWAAGDAQPLRDELDHFSQVVAATIVNQLSLRASPPSAPINLVRQ